MIEAEVWAVDAELGQGLLDQVGRIRADGNRVLIEGHWAEFASRRAIPDLQTGEEIVISDDPERWVASLIALIRANSVGYLYVVERVGLSIHADGGEALTELREKAAQLSMEARVAIPTVDAGECCEKHSHDAVERPA